MNKIIKAVLVDDEPRSIKSLEWELSKFSDDIIVLATFTDPGEAFRFIKAQQVDCVFLDIEMPEMDGFQLLSKFEERNFDVVFVTAYDQFAINAIKENAVDYLLKPIDTDDLFSTIRRIKYRTARKNDKDLLEESLVSFSNKRISIPMNGKIIFLQTDEIIFCESDGNYCKIFLEDKRTLFVTRKLKEVFGLLPSEKFFRVHNSYVVNLKKVQEYLKTEGYIVLSNNKKIPVSRSRKSSFLDKV